MKRLIICLLFLQASFLMFGQNGNFRSRVSGNWDVPSTWERDADGNGTFEQSPSSVTPSFTDGTIVIQNGHTVRVYVDVSIDQTTIETTGRIVVNSTNVLTVVNGPGVDLLNQNRLTTTFNSNLVIASGAEFVHSKNGGELPLATWADNSTCTITNVTTGMPTNLNQGAGGFYNFNWNCPTQSTTVFLSGNLRDVRGDLTITSTNGNVLSFATTSAPTLTVGGNLVVSGTSRISMTTTAAAAVNVGGNFDFSSSHASGSQLVTASGPLTMSIGGALNITNGAILNLSASSGTTQINLAGNFALTSGTITETSTGSGTIAFNGVSSQSFQNSGSILNTILFVVNAGSTLSVPGENAITGNTLTLNGTLRVGSTNSTGAIVTGNLLGNIRTTNRVFNSGSRIVYAGTAAQFIGIGHPSTTGVITEIDNASGVSFNSSTSGNSGSSNLNLGGDLVLTNGNLTISGTSNTRNLTVQGATSSTNGTISFAGSNVNVTINGSGTFGTLANAPGQTIRTLTVNRLSGGTVGLANGITVSQGTTITAGTLQLAGTSTLTGAVTLGSSAVLDFQDDNLTLSNNFTSSGGTLSANAASSLTLTSGTVLTSPLSFTSPGGNTLGSLTLNKNNGGTSVVVSSPLTIANNLTLTDGELNIVGSALSMGSGSTLSIASIASISGSSPGGSPWNLIYTAGGRSTGLEIPTPGILESLTVNTSNGATISLTKDLTLNTFLSIPSAGRNFNCNGNNLTVGTDLELTGTFSAPTTAASTGLTVLGDLNNSGTFMGNNGTIILHGDLINNASFNHGTGTIVFNGDSELLGSVTPTFNEVVVEGSLSTDVDFLVTGDFTNNGTFDGNAATVTFNKSGVQRIKGSQPADFGNITVSNTTSPVSLAIETTQRMHGVLTLSSNSVLDADGLTDSGNFVLASDASGDARVPQLPAGASIIGQVTVQRYFPAHDNIDRFFSSAVTGGKVSDIQQTVFVTGTFPQSNFPCGGLCDPVGTQNDNGASLTYYNEAVKGAFNNGYVATPATNGSNTEALVVGRGYKIFLWDAVTAKTIGLRGTLNSGTVNFTVKHTASSPVQPAADGWNFVGNPYASAIQWNGGSGWARSANIDPTVWVWDVDMATWRSYNHQTSGGNLPGGLISSGQGFWVYVTPGAATLSVNEAAKSSSSASYYRTKNSNPSGITIEIEGNDKVDEAYLIVTEEAGRGIDFGLDAVKMEQGIESMSISFIAEGVKLGHMAIAPSQVGEDFSLRFRVRDAGRYQIKLSSNQVENFDQYFLVDRQLGEVSSVASPYRFAANAGDESDNRFILTKNPELYLKEIGSGEGKIKVTTFPNPTDDVLHILISDSKVYSVSLLNQMGQVMAESVAEKKGDESHAEIQMKQLPSGMYIVRVLDGEAKVSVTKVVKR